MAHLNYSLFAVVIGILASLFPAPAASGEGTARILLDAARNRHIPIEIYHPPDISHCTAEQQCPVAIISPGYGVSHTAYSFIAHALISQGYLVVAVQHELPADPPLAREGDLFSLRSPVWKRGAENIRFAQGRLSVDYAGFDWRRLVLVGHSNGGDISAWMVQETPADVAALVTLDHRRVPLPVSTSPRTLSIRASDYEADHGVLTPATCVVTLSYARHNQMSDAGSMQLKGDISSILLSFLQSSKCPASEA